MHKIQEQLRLERALQDWKDHRGRTYLLLRYLKEEELRIALPRPGLNTFVKHLEEMVSVQKAYTSALVTGKLDFGSVPSVFEFPNDSTNEDLKHKFAAADKALEKIVKTCPEEKVIDMFGVEARPLDVIQGLIQHEIFHHGQIVAFAYILKIQLPEDWYEAWALPHLESR